ncbi:MAG: hypothetical protein WA884_16315, partial [Methyloceanibacter sp.]
MFTKKLSARGALNIPFGRKAISFGRSRAAACRSKILSLNDRESFQHGCTRLNESIEIGPYLSRLCDSLAKSMVGERRPVSIKVQATSGAATS